MDLSELFEMWLGVLGAPQDEARCLFLGAGFTKSCNDDAPLFNDYVAPLRRGLLNTPPGLLPEPLMSHLRLDSNGSHAPSDLVELYDQVFGRRAVTELLLSEPPETAGALHPFAQRPSHRDPPSFTDSVFRTFDQWKQALQSQPAHLAVLDPRGPAVLLGRLVAEGATPLVLSTNWDSYVELGCWLAGVQVSNAGVRVPFPSGETARRLVVYDRGEDAALHARHDGHSHLLKLHGGVDGVALTLQRAAEDRLRHEDIDAALKRSFLVATSDLTHWRDSSQWVQDATSDALRSHRTVFIGVSGVDPVIYRATRARLAEWEHHASERERAEVFGHSLCDSDDSYWPPLAAIDLRPTPRLYGMMAASRSYGVGHPVVQSDAGKALRTAYAWWLSSHLLRALRPELCAKELLIHDCLRNRLKREIARGSGPTPLIDLLCDAIGPGARWAAIAEARPPLEERTSRPECRWRYAPWFSALPRSQTAIPANLREIAACAVALSRVDADGVTDAWSGVVHVPILHPGGSPLAGSDVLLLPWPWQARSGVGSAALKTAIADRMIWSTGHARTHVGSPQLQVVPVGQVGDGPTEIIVAGAVTRVTRVNWFEEALKGVE